MLSSRDFPFVCLTCPQAVNEIMLLFWHSLTERDKLGGVILTVDGVCRYHCKLSLYTDGMLRNLHRPNDLNLEIHMLKSVKISRLTFCRGQFYSCETEKKSTILKIRFFTKLSNLAKWWTSPIGTLGAILGKHQSSENFQFDQTKRTFDNYQRCAISANVTNVVGRDVVPRLLKPKLLQ